MALLSSHLEQISLCANSIAELPFPGSKMFANALIATDDITALIRDTENHERALFHLAPPPLSKSIGSDGQNLMPAPAPSNTSTGNRRQTAYTGRQPKNKAVAAVLGGDLYARTRRPDLGKREKGDLDVEVLLKGAEKLIAVYPIPGVPDRISQLRRRHQQLAANIQHYEGRVALQQRELEDMNRPSSRAGQDIDEMEDLSALEDHESRVTMTKEDMEREEEEIKALERKKKGLEERVTGMERDLGGLMRIAFNTESTRVPNSSHALLPHISEPETFDRHNARVAGARHHKQLVADGSLVEFVGGDFPIHTFT
nr:uncharacterized protein LOC112020291 [Quercus suber]